MSDEEMEDYGFEYSEEDEPEEDEQIETENTYYSAKGALAPPMHVPFHRDPRSAEQTSLCRLASTENL